MAPLLQPAMAPAGGPPANSVGQLVGYWGPTTSTLDWCEKNYEVNNAPGNNKYIISI